MSSKNNTIVTNTSTLTADKGVISVEGVGSELGNYSMESISKGNTTIKFLLPATAS